MLALTDLRITAIFYELLKHLERFVRNRPESNVLIQLIINLSNAVKTLQDKRKIQIKSVQDVSCDSRTKVTAIPELSESNKF